MNYKLHYEKLISKAQNRSILKTEYKEVHHIIPECMGGKDNKENLIALFPEEHFIAHLLLAKIYPDDKGLLYAVRLMINGKGTKDQNRDIKINHKSYAWIKKKYSEFMSEEMKGKGNHFYGKKHTEESRAKISAKMKGRIFTEEALKSYATMGENQKGNNNPNAKTIKIFNSDDELQFTTNGNFIPFIKENNMPLQAFQDSYRNNGKKLYQTPQGLGKAKQRGFEKYVGWYAVKG